MDELNLNLADSFDAGDVGALVAAYAPEFEPQAPSLLLAWLAWLVGALVANALIFAATVTGSPLTWLPVLVVSGTGAWVTSRGMLAWRIYVYEQTIEKRPYELHEMLACKFREEIEEHRARLLGDDTEWQQTRAALRRAEDDANQSLAYWTDRALEDRRNELAGSHRRTAQLLHSKLSDAVRELNNREDALLTFFAQCEAKIAVLDRSRTDHSESQRLVDLARQADDLVIDANLAIEAIGHEFIDRAIHVGQALGALERLQYKESAGEIELDGVERVAERIIEAAEEEKKALSELVNTMSD